MQLTYETISDFLSKKLTCAFCKSELKVILTNFCSTKDKSKPYLFCPIKNNFIEFLIKFEDSKEPVKVMINCSRNTIYFSSKNKEIDERMSLQAFKNIMPHLEAYCNKRRCKSKNDYCVTTNVFDISQSIDKEYKIENVDVHMESFSLEDMWVQNDWISRKLNIFKKHDYESEPLSFNVVNLHSLGEDKISNRIITMINFA